MKDIRTLLEPLRRLHETIRAAVVEACEREGSGELAKVVAEEESDTIFAIDRVSEEIIVDFFEAEVASKVPIVLIAEGIDKLILPRDADEAGHTVGLGGVLRPDQHLPRRDHRRALAGLELLCARHLPRRRPDLHRQRLDRRRTRA